MRKTLPKKLIKKYGISKKAWEVYNKQIGKKVDKQTVRMIKKGTRSRKVAKRKGKRKQKVKQDFGSKLMRRIGKPVAAVAYGFTRDMISDKIAESKLGQKLPAFEFVDEATMLALAFGARKLGMAANPIGRQIINSAEIVEWARIGEGLNDMRQAKKATGSASMFG